MVIFSNPCPHKLCNPPPTVIVHIFYCSQFFEMTLADHRLDLQNLFELQKEFHRETSRGITYCVVPSDGEASSV